MDILFNLHRPVISASATRYVLLTVLSFAASVIVTRVYLELTGYPQIGNDTFHFAHALWGGLLLIISVLTLLIFVNRWTYDLSAILAGIGVGLFIDEVGKFITQQNDYFFPLAAPIIYVAFLVMLLVYLIVKRRETTTDLVADMYQVTKELEEVLEDDLSECERDSMVARLQKVAGQTARPDLADLAKHILQFLQSESVDVVPDRTSLIGRFLDGCYRIEDSLFTQGRTRLLLIGLFLLDGLGALFAMLVLGLAFAGDETTMPTLLSDIVLGEANVTSSTSLSWFLIMSALQLVTGLLLFLSAVAFLRKNESTAVTIAMMALVISLVFISPLSFYFNQFSVLLTSLFLFTILLILQRYRTRFLTAEEADIG